MNKQLTPWRAIIISIVFAASFITPLFASHASSATDRNSRLNISFDDPEAVFDEARIVHNVTVDGAKGMRVHAKFHVRYGKGVPCRMIAYFYYDDTKNTPLKASSEADYHAYRTVTGQVSASTRFTPAYDPALYDDLLIVETSIVHITRATLRFEYRLLRQHDVLLLATGRTEHVFMSEVGRIIRVADKLLPQLFRNRESVSGKLD